MWTQYRPTPPRCEEDRVGCYAAQTCLHVEFPYQEVPADGPGRDQQPPGPGDLLICDGERPPWGGRTDDNGLAAVEPDDRLVARIDGEERRKIEVQVTATNRLSRSGAACSSLGVQPETVTHARV